MPVLNCDWNNTSPYTIYNNIINKFCHKTINYNITVSRQNVMYCSCKCLEALIWVMIAAMIDNDVLIVLLKLGIVIQENGIPVV